MSASLRFLKMLGESGFWKGVGRLHLKLYRWSGGRIGHSAGGVPSLLLTTVGRKSGEPRTVALAYMPDGNDYVIVASNGGADRHPAWWLNLEKAPRARVQVGRDTAEVVAVRAEGKERARLWSKLTAVNPFFSRYEKITRREIPIVILRRLEETSPPAAV